jgi:hypothetical protein
MRHEVTIKKPRRICDPQILNCNTSKELQAAKAGTGPERAATQPLLQHESLDASVVKQILEGT